MALTTSKLRELRQAKVGPTGNKVAKAIELAGVTQMEVSTATRLPQPYISDVARGRYEDIMVNNATAFADYFGCHIEDLFPARQEMSA